MGTDQQQAAPQNQPAPPAPPASPAPHQAAGQPQPQRAERAQAGTTDGLADKKPEDLTPEELRLMADTMPGEGPGD